MARITVEDCLTTETNRFGLVLLASRRSKQLLNGSKRVIKDNRGNKAVVTALREIADGKVRFMVDSVFVQGFVRDLARADLIYKIDGKRVYSADEVEDVVSHSEPRNPIELTLRRGGLKGEEREVEVKPLLR